MKQGLRRGPPSIGDSLYGSFMRDTDPHKGTNNIRLESLLSVKQMHCGFSLYNLSLHFINFTNFIHQIKANASPFMISSLSFIGNTVPHKGK